MKRHEPRRIEIRLKKMEKNFFPRNSIPAPRMEFHVARSARDKYEFSEEIFSSTGNVILADFQAVRMFAYKMNQKRDLSKHPDQAIRPGQLNAMGLIDEILHYVIYLYRQEENPEVMSKALLWLYDRVGEERTEKALKSFATLYPCMEVYKGEMGDDEYYNGMTEGIPNKLLILEEMLMLWIANMNPAFGPYGELFPDGELKKNSQYLEVIEQLHTFFDTQPLFGPDSQNLVDMLRSPAIAHPYSLKDQLEYIKQRWGMLLGKYLLRLLSGFDLIREEDKMRGFGKPLNEVCDYSGHDKEYERFSADREWMPKVVLIAKSTLVWLDQLSKEYERSIITLDQVPDEELDKLASYGFTGLWLIGLWERSSASKAIKISCGNPDAESSAYSLYDYTIASELGGYDALNNLRERCWKRGIRLASDMVPNHTGIDSRWVHEHPDWYVQLSYPPFPGYTFNSQNLSSNPGIGCYLEDHYYNRTDAAVVFKRVDFGNGDTRYIYHGNDGTHMPWNDTAQLNFLNPEVRESVIQTIIHVARMFPIIRFDAAMTLAKKHFQRLWFPVPGSGGDIPSRAEHGMTKQDFDQAFPVEFWREVVDRIAREVPDTLLLAEAFWLMEGYFVRTLGMHRVYNSAFMNMMKMEDNQKYRSTIKNTMEFDPEILKRFVNFMNNPDEETAVAQFGKGDKYFGTCMMMVTMPGLPMFGHAQVEGFTEKYGMEYRKAYWDETPDQDLIERHKRDIFPVVKRRYLFAEVKNFLLYDLFTPEGWVNENVFAYSNRFGMERSLVFYNNKYDSARGWIKMSAAYAERLPGSDEKRLSQRCLGEGLKLPNDSRWYMIFREHISGKEFIRNCQDVWDNGLYVELGGFEYQLFWEFREVCDNEFGHYGQVAGMLQGRGVDSIDNKLKELMLGPIYEAVYNFMNKGYFDFLIDDLIDPEAESRTSEEEGLNQFKQKIGHLFEVIRDFYHVEGNGEMIIPLLAAKYNVIRNLPSFKTFKDWEKGMGTALKFLGGEMKGQEKETLAVLFIWLFFHQTGEIQNTAKGSIQSRSWIDEWFLGYRIPEFLKELGLDESSAWEGINLIKVLITHQEWYQTEAKAAEKGHKIMSKLLKDQDVLNFINANTYDGVVWFNKEKYDRLLWWLFVVSVTNITASTEELKSLQTGIKGAYKLITQFKTAEKSSEYQVGKLLENLN